MLVRVPREENWLTLNIHFYSEKSSAAANTLMKHSEFHSYLSQIRMLLSKKPDKITDFLDKIFFQRLRIGNIYLSKSKRKLFHSSASSTPDRANQAPRSLRNGFGVCLQAFPSLDLLLRTPNNPPPPPQLLPPPFAFGAFSKRKHFTKITRKCLLCRLS